MQGLMLKLLNVDAAGERALRVVSYFDQLGANRPDLDSVVRATALIADCAAGIEVRDRGLLVRYGIDGESLDGPAGPAQRTTAAPAGEDGAAVWLERGGTPRDLDEFIVERFALTAGAVLARERPSADAETALGFADPALAQLLVNDRASEPERSRAGRLIGLKPGARIQLVALEPHPEESLTALTSRLRAHWKRPIHVAELSRHLAVMVVVTVQPIDFRGADIAGRAAAGSVVDVLDAPASWTAARESLRFAGAGASWPRALMAEDIGVVRLLGQLDPVAVARDPDVVRIQRLASGANGPESISILDHFLHSDSIRSAAREVNFHHSSLQTRVRRIGEALGIDLKTAAGRERAALALLLWRTTRAI